MKRDPVTAVAIAADPEHVEVLPWFSRARYRPLTTDELRTAAAAVEDAGASLVSVPLGDGDGWRCYVREGDCLVSAELEAVACAVDSVRDIARACRAAEPEASR